MNLRSLIVALCSCVALAAAESRAQNSPAAEPTPGRRFALLVGCSTYSSLGPKFTLEGPANDVVLFDRLLRDRFRFVDGEITRLVHVNPGPSRPTYANIVREMDR